MSLNIYSQYTTPEGSIKYKDLILSAKKCNFTSLGMTDHGNFAGLIEFYNLAVDNGIKPIIGIDLFCKLDDSFVRIIFYIKNRTGYEDILNLLPHLKQAKDGYYYFDKEFFPNLDNLFCILNIYDIDFYSNIINLEIEPKKIYESLFTQTDTGNVFFQIIVSENDEDESKKEEILNYCKSNNKFKTVALNPIFYLNKEDYEIKNLLIKIHKKSCFLR